MNKVTTINLNGRSYQVEETGFEKLRAYLDSARATLAENPDVEEVVADLEQAIAEKCNRYLSSGKNVVNTDEIETIIKEMGPVEKDTGENTEKKGEEKGPEANQPPVKRLYRIKQGRMLTGVCNGIAAYFNMDVTLVRFIFVILTFITGGGLILAYIIASFIIPRADTTEDEARAFGIPYTAHDVIERAKAQYAKFKAEYKNEYKDEWKAQLRDQKEYWKYKTKKAKYDYEYRHKKNGWVESILGMLWLAFLIWLFVRGYQTVPAIHDFFDAIGYWIQGVADKIQH